MNLKSTSLFPWALTEHDVSFDTDAFKNGGYPWDSRTPNS